MSDENITWAFPSETTDGKRSLFQASEVGTATSSFGTVVESSDGKRVFVRLCPPDDSDQFVIPTITSDGEVVLMSECLGGTQAACDCVVAYGTSGVDYVYFLRKWGYWVPGDCLTDSGPLCLTGDPAGPNTWVYRSSQWTVDLPYLILPNPCLGYSESCGTGTATDWAGYEVFEWSRVTFAEFEADYCSWPPPTSAPWATGACQSLYEVPSGIFTSDDVVQCSDPNCAYSFIRPLVRPTKWCNPATATWEDYDGSSDYFYYPQSPYTFGGIPKSEWDAIVALAGTNHAIEMYLSQATDLQCPCPPAPYGEGLSPITVGTASVDFPGNANSFHVDSYSFVEPC